MTKKFLPLLALLLPGLAGANPVAPSQTWLADIKSEQPLYPFRMSQIELVHSAGVEATRQQCYSGGVGSDCLPVLTDYELALRGALRSSGFFDKKSPERAKLTIRIDQFSTDEVKTTYSIVHNDALLYQRSIGAKVDNYFVNSDARRKVLAANIKYLLIDLRRVVDPKFDERSAALLEAAAKEANQRTLLSYAGEGLGRGFYGLAVGGIAVAKTVGEVAKTTMEVVGSEEFATTLANTYREADARDERMRADFAASMARAQEAGEAERRRRIEAESGAEAPLQNRVQEETLARPNYASSSSTNDPAQARQAGSASQRAEAEALAAKKAAERRERIAQQEREARLNAQQQMRQFAAASQNIQSAPSSQTGRTGSVAESTSEPIVFMEGVVVCPPGKDHDWLWGEQFCEGPFQRALLNLKAKNLAHEVSSACGSDRGDIRDLGVFSGHRVFGCGFGINPQMKDWPNRDTAEKFGLVIPPRRTYRCPPDKNGYCMTQ